MNIDWTSVLEISEKLLRIAAIIVGALWVYFNWVRGRTFVPRLQLELSGKVLNRGQQQQLLLVTIQVRNVGSSIVQLRSRGTGLKLISLVNSTEVKIANPFEREITAFAVLEKEIIDEQDAPAQRSIKNIEPGTAINEQKLIVVNRNKYNAFRLELKVFAFGGNLFGRRLPDRGWRAIAIAVAEDSVQTAL